MIQPERIQRLNRHDDRDGAYVLYWMQSAQRAEYNHALEYAIGQANRCARPLLVFFGLTDDYPGANERHYTFMLEGLREVQLDLAKRGIAFAVQHVPPDEGAARLARRACRLITDEGYTEIQRRWRRRVARTIDCPLIQVETNVVVPVATVSNREEYAAATIRPKIHRHLEAFCRPLRKRQLNRSSLDLDVPRLDLGDVDRVIARLDIDRGVSRSDVYVGGNRRAQALLRRFIRCKLDAYADDRHDPNRDGVSHLSPYLHFGQISPLYVALQVRPADSPGGAAFLEELIVRRELAVNFVRYNRFYRTLGCLPNWARNQLKACARDKRPYVYRLEELEAARTHDPYWNAAQRQMVLTGRMHGYMRMYWGKKILEWTRSPGQAYRIAVYLNDKYELDGRDPNGYAGIAWCFGKHDRPWAGRPIFGNVRYMNAAGLKRKFDADRYAARFNAP
ncbi:MAG: deoxyribodipyrimidine photo-lyase [Sedimentisphaerales bacterium]|nr:deoxyribodipyrimidine photo-lyase [Sedimentisphaerales bacterium]